MNKRLIKCLKRINENKSIPDFYAVFMLQDRKLVNIYGNSSDDLAIEITEKGKLALAAPSIKDNTQGEK